MPHERGLEFDVGTLFKRVSDFQDVLTAVGGIEPKSIVFFGFEASDKSRQTVDLPSNSEGFGIVHDMALSRQLVLSARAGHLVTPINADRVVIVALREPPGHAR